MQPTLRLFHTILVAALLLGLPVAPALAQVSLTDFAAYTQNFNGLSASSAEVDFINNSTLPGVYAQAVLAGLGDFPGGTAPVPCYGNDGGQHPEANYYSFGTVGSSDRALGGIATSVIANGYPLTGNGYVAMRFVNNTGRSIANLEVSYAMEQWYNSGKVDKAQVAFDYQVLTGTFAGQMEAGTWTNVAALGVDAPSTATMVSSKNGNSPANRRVLTATINGLNLAAGKEVVLRWKYVLNAATNGNGLAIDDVSVTPQAGGTTLAGGTTQASIFYYDGSGSLTDKTNWASRPDNLRPASFTANNQIFYITTTTAQVTLTNNLVSGTNSKLIIGDGTAKVSVAMTPAKSDASSTIIDVASNSTLEIKGKDKDGLLPTLGKLSPGSTVYYNTTRTDVTISCASFGNLKINGNDVVLTRNVTVSGTLSLAGNSQLQLNVYDLTMLKGGVVTTDGTSYVRTNASGALRQTVPTNNTAVLFPVGQNSYNPAWLSQPTTATEDVFGIAVSDSVFASYDILSLGNGTAGLGKDAKGKGLPLTSFLTSVNHTWYITEVEKGASNVTLKLQSELPLGMSPSQVMVGHYHNSGWDNDTQQKGKLTAISGLNLVYQFTRTGIRDFSPFALNTSAPSSLPVELVSFTASRTGSTVACAWATASEQHNDHFTLERSLDGQTFGALTTVVGMGNTSARHDYTYVDAQPLSTTAYYRLRQVDTDGTVTFSPVVVVSGTSATVALTAFPNPTASTLTLMFSTATATTVRGTVTNVVGAEVLRFAQAVEAGAQALPLDLGALPAGVYLVRVATTQGSQMARVVKQ